ncbi:hypothetical protein EYC80_004285 [Monilinia laxa]|uniref:Uncharacterized protein n=1 Tax=Monilinia laxa TaxID=61186 RepID=A0A5N6KMA4_MONLA|nr:hypothetical protein EYC80_004285 [Monilinia laxa]
MPLTPTTYKPPISTSLQFYLNYKLNNIHIKHTHVQTTRSHFHFSVIHPNLISIPSHPHPDQEKSQRRNTQEHTPSYPQKVKNKEIFFTTPPRPPISTHINATLDIITTSTTTTSNNPQPHPLHHPNFLPHHPTPHTGTKNKTSKIKDQSPASKRRGPKENKPEDKPEDKCFNFCKPNGYIVRETKGEKLCRTLTSVPAKLAMHIISYHIIAQERSVMKGGGVKKEKKNKQPKANHSLRYP